MVRFAALIVSLLAINIGLAGQLNSAAIVKDTFNALPKCIHYQVPTHFCLWLSPFGKINTTPILNHYLPDLVVTVFNKPNDNPWIEANTFFDKAGKPIQEKIVKGVTGIDVGNGNHILLEEHEQRVIFKEVDVIGNPALALIPSHGLLPSTVYSLMPYYQSMTDSVLWRGLPPAALPEEGMAFALNVTYHIGKGLVNWGGIFPHEGKVIADNDVKASAVIAERAVDLLTSDYPLAHICKRVSTDCGEHCKASPIQENSIETYFQMIYPITQNDCHILGDEDSYSPNMINQEGAYVWIVWRHYEGCADGDGKYIGRS